MAQLIWFVSGIFVYSFLSVGFSFIKTASADTSHDYFKFSVTGPGRQRYPIVYQDNYNIDSWILKMLLPFDIVKWRKTHKLLADHFKGNFSSISPLKEADENLLSIHHTRDFLEEIHNSNTMIAKVGYASALYWLPNSMLRSKLIEPFKWQASGTILASRQAMLHGSAVNLGGGMHHSYRTQSEYFCFFADIGLTIQYLWNNVDKNLKFLVIDLDIHQGNGIGMDKSLLPPSERDKILIMDMYNKDIFQDKIAQKQINYKIEVQTGTATDEYLDKLTKAVNENSEEMVRFKPDLVIYNAGTDMLEGNPLGLLKVTEQGIIQRDEFIFKFCRDNNLPVVLIQSGGYEEINASVVAKSIINLIEKGLIKPIDESSSEATTEPPTGKGNRRDIKIEPEL